MKPNSNSHIAVRVANMQRSIDFYRNVFEAEVLAGPFPLSGPFAAVVSGGPEGVRWNVAITKMGDGVMELFELVEPDLPLHEVHMTQGNLLHFGVQVEDVDKTLEFVEANGGKRFWPEVADMGDGLRVIYVHDLDYNVIEVINKDMCSVAEQLTRSDLDRDANRG
jgi:catechol 2,3-dioxygenase-like lactoylglutathione lyase family enzyme